MASRKPNMLHDSARAIESVFLAMEDRAQVAFRAGVHYIVSGSFKSTALYLLAFDPIGRTLEVTSTTPAEGPHQYLALNEARDRVYATTWGMPPTLSSWAVEKDSGAPTLRHVNSVSITATSSYISLHEDRLYSAGGPTAEVHEVNEDGGFGEKMQQLVFVPQDELATTDKTRKALRVGSHGFDLTPDGKAFVPHLGRNSILMYEIDKLGVDADLIYLSETKSPREKDGPRHVLPSRDGKLLYSVTEHTNFVDVYEVKYQSLKHLQSGQIVPPSYDPHTYRGNTLRLSRDGSFLFGSTRGTNGAHGYVAAFELDAAGKLKSTDPVAHYEMPTTGGIAGAVEPAFWKGSEGIAGQDYLLLVDEEVGYVSVIGWSKGGRKFKEIASTRLPDGATASHALWLS